VKMLAIDTSSEACSVALQDGDLILEQHRVEARAHTRILLPMIRQLLGAKGLRTEDLQAVVLGNGPGSFIGMRIAASVAQGSCFAAGLPLVPVSSLAAVAAEVMESEHAQKVAVAQDARMDEVYFARFLQDGDGLPALQDAETIIPANANGALPGKGWRTAGAGWQRYPALAAGCRDAISGCSSVIHPRARHLLGIGARAVQDGRSIDPAQLQPAYLRMKVASAAAGAAP